MYDNYEGEKMDAAPPRFTGRALQEPQRMAAQHRTGGQAATPLAGVHSATSALADSIEVLAQAVSALEQRLDNGGVLQPTPQRAENAKLASGAGTSGLSSTVYSASARVNGISDRIGEILNRLDV
jgi:hypothetical protein